jgi:hypothetical protein
VRHPGSVDQTENYVFAAEPQGVGRSFGKASHYWISANDFDTMYTLFNSTDRAQDFIATIYYGDGSGSYQMPVHLEAQASTMIDMMMLIGEKQPDVHGNVIPPGVQQGSVVIENPKGKEQWMTLVVSGAVYNPRRGTCGAQCIYCYGYSGFCVLSNPFAVPVTLTTPLKAQATYGDGTVYDFTTSSSWSSDNTPVATVGSSTGVVTGQAPGSVNVTATFPSLVVYTGQVCSYYNPSCPIYAPPVPSPGSVLSVSQTPSQLNMSTGDTGQVTVSVQPSSLNVNVSFGSSRFENPNSSCGSTLNIPNKSGTGSITQNVTASPAGCSGAFTVVASAGGVSANSPTTVDVPPQVLIQMMQAEAQGTGNSGLMQQLGEIARNRFSSSFFDPPYTNYQNAIPGATGTWPVQFATTSTTTGIEPELDAAVTVFLNDTPDVCGALSFWTPTLAQWQIVQAAWQNPTTTFPSNTGAPTYNINVWPTSNQQIIYSSSVGTQSNGAPNFLFLSVRNPTDFAVVSGACP